MKEGWHYHNGVIGWLKEPGDGFYHIHKDSSLHQEILEQTGGAPDVVYFEKKEGCFDLRGTQYEVHTSDVMEEGTHHHFACAIPPVEKVGYVNYRATALNAPLSRKRK